MTTLTVKSGYLCPLCGQEMRMLSGSFYYEGELGIVDVACDRCNLTIAEYGNHHGLKSGEANSYWKLVHALEGRLKNVCKKA